MFRRIHEIALRSFRMDINHYTEGALNSLKVHLDLKTQPI